MWLVCRTSILIYRISSYFCGSIILRVTPPGRTWLAVLHSVLAAGFWIITKVRPSSIFILSPILRKTDKKASQVNIMRTRGKRVTAEAVVKRDVLLQQMRVTPESLHYHSVSNVGAFMSGANNNGAHSPNAITALFIATGQDEANVAESSAASPYGNYT